jgi:hypothetical protein
MDNNSRERSLRKSFVVVGLEHLHLLKNWLPFVILRLSLRRVALFLKPRFSRADWVYLRPGGLKFRPLETDDKQPRLFDRRAVPPGFYLISLGSIFRNVKTCTAIAQIINAAAMINGRF